MTSSFASASEAIHAKTKVWIRASSLRAPRNDEVAYANTPWSIGPFGTT